MAMRRFDPYNDPNPDHMKWVVYYIGFSKTPFDEWLKINTPSLVRMYVH